MSEPALLTLTASGLYCPRGDFHIDPWAPTPRAVITHAHADHARPGSQQYLCARPGEAVLRRRLGDIALQTLDYGESLQIGDVRVSLHPAGHILGSAQVRLETGGQVAVVSGDYKTTFDATCVPFEPIRCHTFVTESTFGLPIYRWPDETTIFNGIRDWWHANQQEGRASLLFAYALGKAQRLLAGLDAEQGPIYCHGAVEAVNEVYRQSGVRLAETQRVGDEKRSAFADALIVAPPSAQRSPWVRRFGDYSSAFVSGWMRVRGARRRRAVDRGFVLSDHADWPGLLDAIRQTGANTVLVTHG
ncbi:MAG TPA: ligase-associated DNA damage response exonuclease [Gemmataceae bacterium]|nr:ligase-associated DNA damage response exonuclease [Gemmataceae bacterium]